MTIRPALGRAANIAATFTGIAVAASLLSSVAMAGPVVSDVAPTVVMGSGIPNGEFTVAQSGNLELGLRARPRNGPHIVNWDGDYTYTYTVAQSQPWNFDWTINTDFSDVTSAGDNIDAYTYILGVDFDPGIGTAFSVGDYVNVACADHSFGNNSTLSGAGVEANCGGATAAADYAALYGGDYNVLQQSWRHAWIPAAGGFVYDGTIDGTYDIYLAASRDGKEIARTSIQVIIGEGGGPDPVPEPTTLAVFGLGFMGLGLLRRRRKSAANV